jgi:cytochrome oxidase Cu insertion factor (SCO1/SenC/PrrC family)
MQGTDHPLLLRRILFAGLMLLAAAAIVAYALMSSPVKLPGSGAALVGGPFSMVNQRGEPVTDRTFLGKPMLLFFGFTFCPDVCPTELQVMAAALAELGEKGKDIQPIFVSIDPERDTPWIMANYVANFGDRFIGLTGSPAQVEAMAGAYRVFYARQENKERPADYLMDHSSIIYLMAPDGIFLKHFTYTTDAKSLAQDIAAALGR